MRIGMACFPTYGGSGVVASELALALADRGHQVHVLSYALPFRLRGGHANLRYHEIAITHYPLFPYPPFTLSAACSMSEAIEREDLQILHAHYAIPWAVCAHLAREVAADKHGTRLVTTVHGTDITLVGAEPEFFRMTRFGLEQSDAVTAVSSFLAEQTRRTFGVTRTPEVIHNGVDGRRYRPRCAAARRKQFARRGEKVLAHVSNFRPVKNAPHVVKVFAGVRARFPARLLMVGEGPELPAARALARQLAVEQDVLFLGNQEAVEEVLPCADVFVLPSSYESFGLAALEAMSCGVPVLASAVGGLGEVVSSGVDGWLCRPGDIEGMTARAIELLADPARRREMGRAARRKALTKFALAGIVDQYERLYRRLAGERAAPEGQGSA